MSAQCVAVSRRKTKDETVSAMQVVTEAPPTPPYVEKPVSDAEKTLALQELPRTTDTAVAIMATEKGAPSNIVSTKPVSTPTKKFLKVQELDDEGKPTGVTVEVEKVSRKNKYINTLRKWTAGVVPVLIFFALLVHGM